MAVRTANSNSYPDVNKAVNGGLNDPFPPGPAPAGTIVRIPVGPPVDWGTNRLVVTTPVIIEGQGMTAGGTDITTHFSGANQGAIEFRLTTSPTSVSDTGAGWGIRKMKLTCKGDKGNSLRLCGVGEVGNQTQALAASPIKGTSGYFRVSEVDFETGDTTATKPTTLIETLDVFGVFDHCIFHPNGIAWCHPHNERWGGFYRGHGSFSEIVEWGSDKFVYFEDCWARSGGVDGYHGSRVIARHCTIDVQFTNHGTETGSARGTRAMESYNNWYRNILQPGGKVNSGPQSEIRSGTFIEHDCIFETPSPQGINNNRLWQNHRQLIIKDYGSVAGRNPAYARVLDNKTATGPNTNSPTVDKNTKLQYDIGPDITDTLPSPNPNGIVLGLSGPFNQPVTNNVSSDEDSFPAHGPSTISPGVVVITAATNRWTADRWVTLNSANYALNKGYTYQCINVSKPKMSAGVILDNDPDKLYLGVIPGSGDEPISCADGDTIVIRRCIAALDQPGLGVSDEVVADSTIIVPAVNTLTSVGGDRAIGWPNQKLDPCYTWNCRQGDGTLITSRVIQGEFILGRDFFHERKPFPNYTPLLGGRLRKEWSPGYPDATTQGADAKRIGAYGIPGLAADFVQWSTNMTGTVTGLDYPHPLIQTIYSITSANTASFTSGTGGSHTVTTNLPATVSYTESHGGSGQGFPSTGTTFNPSTGVLTVGATTPVGIYSFVITATTTASGIAAVTQGFTLTVSAVATRFIEVSPAGLAIGDPLAFGDHDVGTSTTKNVNIKNSGNTAFSITDITVPTRYAVDSTSGTVAPNATKTVTVTFTPNSAATFNGNFIVTSTATSGSGTIAVTGIGVNRVIGLSGNLAFGNVTIGQTPTRQLTIANTGNRDLYISAISYPAGFTGDFSSATVPAGGSKILTVTFSPTAAVLYSGDVVISGDQTNTSGTANEASISGTGVATTTKIIGLTGGPLDFGSVQTGTTSDKILTITNSGDTILHVSSIDYPTGFSGAFTGNIGPNASHDVTVTFAPVAITSYSGDITVNSDATSGIDTTTASGTGAATNTRIITLTGNMNFGNVAVGSSSQRTLTIANSGTVAMNVSSIDLPTVWSSNLSGILNIPANESRNVTITFTPTNVTPYTGTLTVNSNATSGTNTRTVNGTGVAPTTRVIRIVGKLAFGNVQINHSVQKTITVFNDGTAVLAVSNVTVPTDFSVNWTSGNIQPGGSKDIGVTFRPTTAQSYSGLLTVVCNKTSGTNTVQCSGVGKEGKQAPMFIKVV